MRISLKNVIEIEKSKNRVKIAAAASHHEMSTLYRYRKAIDLMDAYTDDKTALMFSFRYHFSASDVLFYRELETSTAIF